MKYINPGHVFRAGANSIAGLIHAFKSEQSFRHEVLILPVLALALIISGKSFGVSLLVLVAWLMVLAVELLNSSIEQSFDLISLERDPRIKAGKDMASGAIFLTIAANVGLWLWVWI